MDRQEAIKVIKHNWPESRHQLSEALQTLIPELNESEDERIKKEIIQFLQLPHPQFVGKRNHEEWIAWLEKQGERSDRIVEIVKSAKQSVIITESHGDANIDWDARSLQDVKMLLECGLKHINSEIEKQGEQKFKVGDLVVTTYGGTHYIEKIKNNRVYVLHGGCIHIEDIDHIWTIKDAKNGDVLANDTSIIIFRKLGNDAWNDVVDYYVGYSHNSGKIVIQSGKSHYGKIDTVTFKPATEEQRDLLFQKMKEAGYIWDSEKRELKQIEQEWSEEDEKTLNTVIEKGDLKPSEIEWLKSLKERYTKISKENVSKI